jgi:uncharacterized protein with HEPN domain
VIRNLAVIGEAANRLSGAFVAQHLENPWREIAGIRHRLVGGYFAVNLHLVWQTVDKDLAALQRSLRTLLDAADPRD